MQAHANGEYGCVIKTYQLISIFLTRANFQPYHMVKKNCNQFFAAITPNAFEFLHEWQVLLAYQR